MLLKKKIITRLTDRSEHPLPYLIRYSIFTCPWFAIKIHHILISDDECLHDHPWAFWSFILKGGYWEITPVSPRTITYATYKQWYGRFSFLRRHLRHIHRLELPEGKTAWTLVVTFRKKKSWGFFTKQGWIEWFKYKPTIDC